MIWCLSGGLMMHLQHFNSDCLHIRSPHMIGFAHSSSPSGLFPAAAAASCCCLLLLLLGRRPLNHHPCRFRPYKMSRTIFQLITPPLTSEKVNNQMVSIRFTGIPKKHRKHHRNSTRRRPRAQRVKFQAGEGTKARNSGTPPF